MDCTFVVTVAIPAQLMLSSRRRVVAAADRSAILVMSASARTANGVADPGALLVGGPRAPR